MPINLPIPPERAPIIGTPTFNSDTGSFLSWVVQVVNTWNSNPPLVKSDAPAGEIIVYAGTGTPEGTLPCDGAAHSRVTYANLFAAIGTTYGAGNGTTTFNVPDIRGRVVRALDNGKGIDPNRALGSGQNGAIEAHTHSASTNSAGSHSHSGTTDTDTHDHDLEQGRVFVNEATSGTVFGVLRDGGGSFGSDTSNDSHNHGFSTNSAGSHSHTVTVQPAGGSETRMINIAMPMFIRF